MRQIAFIGDIHGNLPAAQAVFADLKRSGITEIYCLGDTVGKGPSTSAVLSLVREKCAGVVYGNWDRLVSKRDYMDFNGPWFRERLTDEEIDYLGALPRDICLDVEGVTVRMYHGRWTIDRVVMPYDGVEAIALARDAVGDGDITIMADAHHPFFVMLGGKMLVNTGSAGNPCDGIAKASYYTLSVDEGRVEGRHVRLDYDIAAAIQQAKEAGVPGLEIYEQELLQAKYLRQGKQSMRNG